MSPTIADNWKRFLRSIVPGWDGNGAPAITEEAIRAASRIHVVPCTNGGIEIRTHQSGWTIEIAIGPDGVIESASVQMNTNEDDKQFCTAEHPMPKGATGWWVHDRMEEVLPTPAGLYLVRRCANCGYELKMRRD